MTHTLAAIFVPIGIAGAVLAVICALIVTFALARRAAGLAGGAAGVWIVGALLSWASSFADLWLPLLVSLGALGAALVVGPVLRVLVGGVRWREQLASDASADASRAGEHQAEERHVEAPRVPEPQTQPTRVAPAQARAPGPVTDGIRVAA